MKIKKYHTILAIPKLNITIEERGKIDTPSKQIHDLPHSIKRSGVKMLSNISLHIFHSVLYTIGYNINVDI
jgi:hypothetical protein